MHKPAWLLGGLALLGLFLASSDGKAVATTSTPPSNQSQMVAELLPSGTSFGSVATFTFDNHPYTLLTTMGIRNQPNPWIVVGEQNAAGHWIPVYAQQTRQAFRETATVLGPTYHQQLAIAVTFLVDAATASRTNIDTLLVAANGVRMATVLPDVVAADSVHRTTNGFLIQGLNLSAREGFVNGQWRTTFTPVSQLLGTSNHPVRFALGTSLGPKGKAVPQIVLFGPKTVTVRVGQTLTFDPVNLAGQRRLMGAGPDLGRLSGITVYGGPDVSHLVLDGVAQEMGTVLRFSHPGTQAFAIVPPGYGSLHPNSQVAEITVKVTS